MSSNSPQRVAWPGKGRGLVYLAGALFVLFWGLPRIVMPLATDQAYFALGSRTILNGDQLYRDLWDIKPPLIYLIYSLPAALFGEHVETFRLLDLVNTLLAMVGVFAFTRRFFNERSAFAAAVIYGFAYLTTAGLAGLGQNESFMAGPLMLGLALYPGPEGGNRSIGRSLGCGLLLGIVIAIKFSGAVFVLALPALEQLWRREEGLDVRGAVMRLALAAAGVLAVQAGWMAYLLAAGVLDVFIDIQREYTIPYSGFRWAPEPFSYPRFVLQATTDWFRGNAFIIVPVFAAFVLALFRGSQRAVLFAGLLVLLGLASVWWQGKFFSYHWLIMLPVMAPLAGFAVDQTVELLEPLARRQRGLAVGLLLLGFAGLASASLLSTWDSYRYLVSYASGSISREQLDREYLGQLTENHQLADYVRGHSEAGDGFYVWGFWTAPYYWAERPIPSRYLTSAAVRSDWTPPDWRDELIDDLNAEPPKFFAVAAGDSQPWLTGTAETSERHFCESFPALRNFVDDQYEAVYRNSLFILYERGAEPTDVVTWCDQIAEERRLAEQR